MENKKKYEEHIIISFSRKTRIKLIIIGILFMFCIPIIPAVFGTGTNIVINNNVFSPFNFDTADYKIYNENNELLGNVDANSEFLVWRDPTYRYPTIDVIQSSPFLTDSTGNVIKDEDLELLNPATLEIITEDDKIIYLKKFYVGWDIGLRTYSQLPPIKYYDIPISPLKNVPINHAGGSSSNVFGIYNDPSGVIMAKADVGYLQWRISFFAKDVMVRNSLEPLELTPTILRDKTNIQNDLSLAINSLESNYGNSRVIVKPTFKINAISELIKYDYVKLLENGSQLHIYTTSSKVGFFGVRNAISLKSQGLVTNALTQEILDKGINAEIDTDSPIIQTEDKTLPSDTTGYISERSYDAFFKYTKTEQTNHGGINRIYSGLKTNIIPQEIDINNFNLLTNAEVEMEFELQPLTTVSWANYNLKYLGWIIDDRWPDKIDTVVSGSKTILFPYKLKITNVYAIQRLIFEVACLTENKAEILVTEGEPIDVDDIADYDLNEQGLLPNFNDQQVTVTEREFDWRKWLSDIGGSSLIIIIIIGIGAIAVVFIIIRMRSSGGLFKKETTQIIIEDRD